MKTTTKRMMMVIIALIFAGATTSCKKENEIVPTAPAVVISPLTGVWIHEEQISTFKKLTITETINEDLTGSETRTITSNGNVTATSTTTTSFFLQKLAVGFFQNFNSGPTVSVNYTISSNNTRMIKDLESGRHQDFTRVN